MGKKVALITGAAGFIGSHLAERLLKESFRVIGIDNFITGSLGNISHLLKDKGFNFLKHSLEKAINLRGRVDYVLHFASPASPQDYLKFPIQTLKSGSLGTLSTLELALIKKAKFIFASTSEVYGDPLKHPQQETYWGNVNPVGVRSCYDEAKRFGEALTMAYQRRHSVDSRIIRIFNTYGPRMRINDGRVVPNFIYQALRSQPITVYGDGSQTRSFCYVDDLVEGIIRIMFRGRNEPVNLGNPHEFTILRLARLVIKLTGTKSRIVFKPLPEDDPRQRKPDISKARKLLGWQPKVELEEGLKNTLAWFSRNS